MMKIDLKIDTKKVRQRLVDFVKVAVNKAGFSRGIIGLSGGIDSSLVAYISAEALKPENVWGAILPYKTSSPDSESHAKLVAQILGIHIIKVDISPMIDEYFKMFPSADNIRRGNKMSRERMSILYDHSQYLKAIVIGTTNKTEYLLGYGTVYGDSACGINPIGDLYKTHIRQMAIEYGIPEEIINKKPSADLWCGQTDEDELGFKYEDVDKLLFLMIEKKYSINKLIDCGFSKDFIKKVTYLIRKNAFKRHTPPIPRVR